MSSMLVLVSCDVANRVRAKGGTSSPLFDILGFKTLNVSL